MKRFRQPGGRNCEPGARDYEMILKRRMQSLGVERIVRKS
jgi:hypothetical protein